MVTSEEIKKLKERDKIKEKTIKERRNYIIQKLELNYERI